MSPAAPSLAPFSGMIIGVDLWQSPRVVLEGRESSVTLPERRCIQTKGYGTESIAAGAAVIGNAYFNNGSGSPTRSGPALICGLSFL